MATQREVDDFVGASKLVRESHGMKWAQPSPDKCRWRVPVEVDAVQEGEMFFFVNPQFDRSWKFVLLLHAEEVYRWDARPFPSGHRNKGCPDGFPNGKVRAAEHEHPWIEGRGCKPCIRPLIGIDTSTHERMFVAFCTRINVEFRPAYVQPTPKRQLPL